MINARLVTVSEIAEFMSSYKVSQGFNFAEGDPEGNTVRPKIHHVLSSVLTTLGRLPDVQRGITRKYSFEQLQHLRCLEDPLVAICRMSGTSGEKGGRGREGEQWK